MIHEDHPSVNMKRILETFVPYKLLTISYYSFFFKVHISVIRVFFKSALPFVQFLQMTVLYLLQIAIFPFRENEILFAFQTAILE